MPVEIARYEVKVLPADIDVLDHVNNRVYLRWVEEAARYASDVNGWTTDDYLKLGAAWMAREHWIEYLRPCALGDTIEVYTWIHAYSRGRSFRRYTMKNAGKVCCIAATEWVFVDLNTRHAIDCPKEVSERFVVVPSDDVRLKELGISRCVRFTPLGVS